MRTQCGWIHARDEAGATRRTDWRVRETVCEAGAFAREPVHVRRDRLRIAVATQFRTLSSPKIHTMLGVPAASKLIAANAPTRIKTIFFI